MITEINNFLKSYDTLSESMRSEKIQDNSFAAIKLQDKINLNIAYNCLTSEDNVEILQILKALEELIEKENAIREFFEKNNNPLKESFYAFYQSYHNIQDNNIPQKNIKPRFKNFLLDYIVKETE